jgi:hypothetical protein
VEIGLYWMVTAARREGDFCRCAGDGCWVNARGCLAIRYSGHHVSSPLQTAQQLRTQTQSLASLSHSDLSPLTRLRLSISFRSFKRSTVWIALGKSQPRPQPPAKFPTSKSKCTYFLCTTTFSPLAHIPNSLPTRLQHSTFRASYR